MDLSEHIVEGVVGRGWMSLHPGTVCRSRLEVCMSTYRNNGYCAEGWDTFGDASFVNMLMDDLAGTGDVYENVLLLMAPGALLSAA